MRTHMDHMVMDHMVMNHMVRTHMGCRPLGCPDATLRCLGSFPTLQLISSQHCLFCARFLADPVGYTHFDSYHFQVGRGRGPHGPRGPRGPRGPHGGQRPGPRQGGRLRKGASLTLASLGSSLDTVLGLYHSHKAPCTTQ